MTQSRAAASSGSSCVMSDTVTACVTLYAMTTTHAGWGDPARRTGLPPHATTWLHREIGSSRPAPAVAPADRELPSTPFHVTPQAAGGPGEADVRHDDARGPRPRARSHPA